jgi:predicted nucleic acid-binding protein
LTALVDTNLLVSMAVESHKFHRDTEQLFAATTDFMIAGHSLAELYNTLTRPSIYDWPPTQAARFIEQLHNGFTIRTLTVDQYTDGIALFARRGGVGPRVYDFMIGRVAVVHHLDTIVTSNVRDFAHLFPDLTVLTPTQYLETL